MGEGDGFGVLEKQVEAVAGFVEAMLWREVYAIVPFNSILKGCLADVAGADVGLPLERREGFNENPGLEVEA